MYISEEEAGGKNVLIFGDLVGWSEGTTRSKWTKDQGYDVIVGGIVSNPPFPKIMTSYDRHPNVLVTITTKGLKSTAAGRFQILKDTWEEARTRYKWPESFAPIAQDRWFIKKLIERRAYDLVVAGRWEQAITACNREWASFAGSPYNQNPHTMDAMLAQVALLGGKV